MKKRIFIITLLILFVAIAVYARNPYNPSPSFPGWQNIVKLFNSGSCSGYLNADGTCQSLTSSLPVFSDSSGKLVSKSVADTLTALGLTNAVVYKGTIDCSGNPNYPAADAGDAYVVSVDGKIGGASGINVITGDTILCKVDGTVAGTQAAVGANWNIIEQNIDLTNIIITGGTISGANITVGSGKALDTQDGTTTLGTTNVGSTTAGKNLTVNATGTSIFTFDEANINEDDVTWTMTGSGALVHITGNTTAVTLTTTEAIVANTTYKVTITGTGGGATASYTLGGVSGASIAASGAIAIADYITANTTGALVITPSSTCTVSITNITIEKLPNATGDITSYGTFTHNGLIVLPSIGSSVGRPQFVANKSSGTYGIGFDNYGGSSNISSWANGSRGFSLRWNVFDLLQDTSTLRFGANSDVTLTRGNAAGYLLLRNSTNQTGFLWANTWTSTSDYERGRLGGVAGSSINIIAESTGATGGANLDVLLNPKGTGGAGIQSQTTNTGGGFVTRLAEAVSATLSGASGSIAVNVPSGKRILAVQLRVDTVVTSGDGGTTWKADYVNTPTTAIGSGYAFTKNTKVNVQHPAYEYTTDTVTITVTPNSGTFSGGVIRAVVYYADTVTMGNAP
jgi:hypothetical protein